MTFLLIFIAAALTIISLITLSNVFMFPRLKAVSNTQNDLPMVSLMIPARNEAAVIEQTIEKLITQDYPHYEVILLDDNSDDGTGDIARKAGGNSDKLTVLSGQPLADGWMGKNWACHQMQQQARGDLLIFTDADVRWSPGAIHALVAEIQRTNADLYTVWPSQTTITWGERLCVPLMALVILGYLPIIGVHYAPFGSFGAANGQCMAWKRKAYDRIGGHAAVYDNVLDDVTLARMVKAEGMRLRMADGNGFIGCRMYNDWPSVRDGYAKNIMAGYGGVLPLALGTVFHLLVFLLPVVWLLTGWAFPNIDGWPQAPLLLVTMGILIRMVTAAFTHQRLLDGWLMPISVLLMTRIAFQAFYWHFRFGGPKWKGRVIQKQPKSAKSTGTDANTSRKQSA